MKNFKTFLAEAAEPSANLRRIQRLVSSNKEDSWGVSLEDANELVKELKYHMTYAGREQKVTKALGGEIGKLVDTMNRKLHRRTIRLKYSQHTFQPHGTSPIEVHVTSQSFDDFPATVSVVNQSLYEGKNQDRQIGAIFASVQRAVLDKQVKTIRASTRQVLEIVKDMNNIARMSGSKWKRVKQDGTETIFSYQHEDGSHSEIEFGIFSISTSTLKGEIAIYWFDVPLKK